MSVMNDLTDLWEASGQPPHPTPGPAPQAHVPHGTPHERFDPLSEGADKAIEQVRKNLGYQERKPSFMRPFVEMLGNMGTAQLMGSDVESARRYGQMGFNPYAAQDAAQAQEDKKVAENIQILQYLAQQEKARAIHEQKQSELNEYIRHNQEIEKYNTGANGRKLGKQYAPTNLGKLYQERDRAIEAYGEGSPQAQTYDLAIQKATSDTDTRMRNLFASNLEKSFEMLDTKTLTQYSGPKGASQLKVDQALDIAGNPPERYLKYKDALGQRDVLADQIKVFLKGANSEKALEHYNKMTNPSSFGTSPEAAKRQLDASIKLFENEMGTFRNSMKGTSEYTGKGQAEPSKIKSAAEMSDAELDRQIAELEGKSSKK